MLRIGALWLVLLGTTAGTAVASLHPLPPTEIPPDAPATRLALHTYQSTKGFVVAHARGVLTVADGHRRIEVVVTTATQVTGLRSSLSAVAPDDLVRVEGYRTAGRLTADRIEVLLAGGRAVVRRAGPALPRVLSWILDGGVTVPLP
ncbi:MAG: DUF5666 domain-containing protein [Armatimonadota bacterium]|nr:DUF5666 domain-containing protein [Armatimonadota bacterium]